MTNRAMFFVDGSNWYHGLKERGVDPSRVHYVKVAEKLAGPRTIEAIRYYAGEVPGVGNPNVRIGQQEFLKHLRALDPRISIHLGRIESRNAKSEAAKELLEYLANMKTRIDETVFQDLRSIGARHKQTTLMVEKGVDVMLAVDLVMLAERNEFDTAYLLTADGDYTHAVRNAKARGKKVFAASPRPGAQLAGAVDSFIPLDRAWFGNCLS